MYLKKILFIGTLVLSNISFATAEEESSIVPPAMMSLGGSAFLGEGDFNTDDPYYFNTYKWIAKIAASVGCSYQELCKQEKNTILVIMRSYQEAEKLIEDWYSTLDHFMNGIKWSSEGFTEEQIHSLELVLKKSLPEDFKKKLYSLEKDEDITTDLNKFIDDALKIKKEEIDSENDKILSLTKLLISERNNFDSFFKDVLKNIDDYFQSRFYFSHPTTKPENIEKIINRKGTLLLGQLEIFFIDYKVALLKLVFPFVSYDQIRDDENVGRLVRRDLESWLSYEKLPMYPATPDAMEETYHKVCLDQAVYLARKAKKGVRRVNGMKLIKNREKLKLLPKIHKNPMPDFSERTSYIGGKKPKSLQYAETILSVFDKAPSIAGLAQVLWFFKHQGSFAENFMELWIQTPYVQSYIGKSLALLSKSLNPMRISMKENILSRLKGFGSCWEKILEIEAREVYPHKEPFAAAVDGFSETRTEVSAGAGTCSGSIDIPDDVGKKAENDNLKRRTLILYAKMIKDRSVLPHYVKAPLSPVNWVAEGEDSMKYHPATPIQLTSGQQRALENISSRRSIPFEEATNLLSGLGIKCTLGGGSHANISTPGRLGKTLVKPHAGSSEHDVTNSMFEIMQSLSLLDAEGTINTTHVTMRK